MAAAALSVVEGRRQVTALHYDIVGSTALLAALHPEDYRHLQASVHRVARDAIERWGGNVDRVVGDGGYAYFGLVRSYEEAAECAINAATDILKEVGQLRGPGSDEPCSVRIGIATGSVVVGKRAGDGDVEIVGTAPVVAARLQQHAAPNTILTSDASRQLAGELFDFEPLGSIRLKGLEEPEPVWRVLRRSTEHVRFRALRRDRTVLIGRDDAYASVLQCWEAAQEGKGQMLAIIGEAGIGKSRLLAELHKAANEGGAIIQVLQCTPHQRRGALHPFLDAFRSEYPSEPQGTAGEISAEGRTKRQIAQILADQDLQDALVEFIEERARPEEGPALTNRSEALREKAFQAILGIVERWQAERPLLLSVEDLHWADPTTLRLLAYLRDGLVGRRVLIAVTTRRSTDGQEPVLDQGKRVVLQRLPEAEAIKLARAVWPETSELPDAVASMIFEKSDGVPLFICELTRYVAEVGVAEFEDPGRRIEALTSLHDLLSARLDQVGEGKSVLTAASVIGRQFDPILLEELLKRSESDAPVDAILDGARQRGLVEVVRKNGAPIYSFCHFLVQDAAYNSMLRGTRRQLHGHLLDILDDSESNVVPMSHIVLAHHAELAERFEDAIKHYLLASLDSSGKSALIETKALLIKARELVARLPDRADKCGIELEVLSLLGPVLTTLHGPGSSEAQQVYADGVALARGQPRHQRDRWFSMYWGWWFTAPDFGTQRMRAEHITIDMRFSDDAYVRLQALHCQWANQFNQGRHLDCAQSIRRGFEIYGKLTNLRPAFYYGGHDPKVCGLAELGLTHWFLGRLSESRSLVDDAVNMAGDLQHLGSISHAADFQMMLNFYMRDLSAVARNAQTMMQLANRQKISSMRAKGLIFSSWAAAALGDTDSAIRGILRGLELQRESGTREDFPVYMEMLAEIYCEIGAIDAGLAIVNQAIHEAEGVGHNFWLSELYRRRALLTVGRTHDTHDVYADLKQAADIAASQHAIMLELRALATMRDIAPAAFADHGLQGHLRRLERQIK